MFSARSCDEGIGIGRVEEELVEVEIDAALEQGRVVHAGLGEHAATEVLRHGAQRAAEDRALAVAVEVELVGVDRGRAVHLESRVARESIAVTQESTEKQEVQEPLL